MTRSSRGFTLIEVMIVLAIIVILITISMLILGVSPTRAANEAAALGIVRTVVSAEKIYWMTAGEDSYGDFGQLRKEELIDSAVATGRRSGYTFVLSTDGKSFTITANPITKFTGIRSFFADDSGVIRWRQGPGAGPEDTPVGG